MARVQLFLIAVSLVLALAYGQQRGTVVLSQSGVRDSSFTSGLVEVYDSFGWELVCFDGITQNEADVICHQLGYSDATGFSEQSNANGVSNRDCTNSQYLTLFQCSPRPSGLCTSGALEVQCSSDRLSDDPYTGQIRLVDGDYSSDGVVEVYCNFQWGAVCSVDQGAADTICNQLGYTEATSFNTTAISADVPISYRDVSCDFDYTCLSSCTGSSCASSGTSCTERVRVACGYEFLGSSSATVGTCDFTDLEEAISNLIGIIVGVVVAVIVLTVLCITIPICICCCLGVGIGACAAASKA